MKSYWYFTLVVDGDNYIELVHATKHLVWQKSFILEKLKSSYPSMNITTFYVVFAKEFSKEQYEEYVQLNSQTFDFKI